MDNKWTDKSLIYIALGLAGLALGVFSYGWMGALVGVAIGLGGAYGLSRIDKVDSKNGNRKFKYNPENVSEDYFLGQRG